MFVLNTVNIVNLFVRGQHRVFVINIVMCECDLFILRKVRLCVCHHKYWIYIFILFLNTIFSLIIINKETLIRYCDTSFFFVIFQTVRLKTMLIFYQLLTLSPSASRHCCRCWNIIIVVGVSAVAPHCRRRRRRRLVVDVV